MTKAIKDLSMKEYFNNTVRNKRLSYAHDTDQPGSEDVRREDIEVHRYGNYYNVSNVIKTAWPVDPQDFDFPVYNRERIFEHLEHNAEVIHVANDSAEQGAVPLFVIESHKSMMGFSNEVPIYPQQEKEFYNIYELRLRSTLAGTPYRVSSYLTRLI
jgi:hypothetical protein